MSAIAPHLANILKVIKTSRITISDFIIALFTCTDDDVILDLGSNVARILDCLGKCPFANDAVAEWAEKIMSNYYMAEIRDLSKKEGGFHLVARGMTGQHLREFDIQRASNMLYSKAPLIWRLLGALLSADESINNLQSRRAGFRRGGGVVGNEVEENKPNKTINGEPVYAGNQTEERWDALVRIKKVICISIMMHSTNQLCNALQSVVGVFLHASGAPETVRELLAHIGVSVAPDTINQTIDSLSRESVEEMRRLGHTFLVSYAYDNLDIDLKHATPTLSQPTETLVHLTTGTMLPLNHGVMIDDLNCSEELWKKSKNNRRVRKEDIPKIEIEDLFHLHPETLTSLALR